MIFGKLIIKMNKVKFKDIKIGDKFDYLEETWIKKCFQSATLVNGKFLGIIDYDTKVIKI